MHKRVRKKERKKERERDTAFSLVLHHIHSHQFFIHLLLAKTCVFVFAHSTHSLSTRLVRFGVLRVCCGGDFGDLISPVDFTVYT